MGEAGSPTAPGAAPETPAAPPELPIVEAKLREKFGEAIGPKSDFRATLVITVARERMKEILRFLRDDRDLLFTMLLDIVTVDWYEFDGGREPRFDVIYHLLSLEKNRRVQIRVPVSEDDPTLPSIIDVWVGANWFEREAFDLMGITFTGHPNLARILTHPGFSGHPLRKDYRADKRQPFTPPPTVVPHA